MKSPNVLIDRASLSSTVGTPQKTVEGRRNSSKYDIVLFERYLKPDVLMLPAMTMRITQNLLGIIELNLSKIEQRPRHFPIMPPLPPELKLENGMKWDAIGCNVFAI